MIDRYLPVLQEHNPELAQEANLKEWIRGLYAALSPAGHNAEDVAMQVGKSIIAITGRLNPYDSADSVGASFIHYANQP